MVQNINKKSAFVAYQLHDLASDESGSEDVKRKQNTRKKKSRSKKKNSDGALLKDLAMCTLSSKKSKSKAKTMTQENAGKGDTTAESMVAESHAAEVQEHSQKCPIESPFKKKVEEDSKSDEMGAVYSPTHITVTRKDGQKSRTISVAEMMNQLFFFREQNSHLIRVQEQFSVANASLQHQVTRDSEIISSLQNEVAMFRQMCLNLQAEVSQLRLPFTGMSQSHRSIGTGTGAPPGIEKR